MKLMRRLTIAVTLLALFAVVMPAMAQDEIVVSATNPSFSWGAKQDQQATYEWSSTLSNPSRRETVVTVSLQLLDSEGNVVGADIKTVTIAGETEMSVGGEAMLAYADASSAAQYRIVVEAAEKGR
jgi:hypothetical protein